MKYRILIDGNLYYPQKKKLFSWQCYKTLVEHPYGCNYIRKKYGYDIQQALDIIEKDNINIQNRPIFIKRGTSENLFYTHFSTIASVSITLLILFMVLLLIKTGMI